MGKNLIIFNIVFQMLHFLTYVYNGLKILFN